VKHKGAYPPEWKAIADRVKAEARNRCIRCHHGNSREGWRILTVHHLDGDKSNCRWWNLLALCQRCHLTIQAKVDPHTPYMLEHAEWFKPYVAGFYAFKYLKQDISRDAAIERMAELLALELV